MKRGRDPTLARGQKCSEHLLFTLFEAALSTSCFWTSALNVSGCRNLNFFGLFFLTLRSVSFRLIIPLMLKLEQHFCVSFSKNLKISSKHIGIEVAWDDTRLDCASSRLLQVLTGVDFGQSQSSSQSLHSFWLLYKRRCTWPSLVLNMWKPENSLIRHW